MRKPRDILVQNEADLQNPSVQQSMNKSNFSSPHAAKWEKFRESNPEFKEYKRHASISGKFIDFITHAYIFSNFIPLLEWAH